MVRSGPTDRLDVTWALSARGYELAFQAANFERKMGFARRGVLLAQRRSPRMFCCTIRQFGL